MFTWNCVVKPTKSLQERYYHASFSQSLELFILHKVEVEVEIARQVLFLGFKIMTMPISSSRWMRLQPQ
jgi:hypothetical protein